MQHAKRILALTAIAFGLSAGLSPVQAQDRPDRDQREQRDSRQHDSRQQRGPDRDHKAHGRADPGNRSPQDTRGPSRQASAKPPAPQGDRGRGAGPAHRFYKGERLPTQYRNHQYVIDDWRGHQLSAPPRGHRWVQVGVDYVLIAVATGVIAQVILSQ